MSINIGRRQVIAALGGALGGAAAWPLVGRAQDRLIPQIGVLNSISYGPILDRIDAFLDRLEQGGFIDGQTIAIEYRSAEGRAEWLEPLALDLVRRGSKVIVCLTGASTVRAVQHATSTIPIVFALAGDPQELGLVVNLDHPEANVTGAARRTEELNPQRLKVVCEFVPPSRPVAFLLNSDLAPAATTNERIEPMEAAANALGRQLVVIDLAGRQSDVAAVFAGMAQQDVAAFVISTEALFTVFRDQMIALSARHRMAAIFPNREYVLAGGLVSFGADLYEHYRIAGTYTARILKGDAVADLPVQSPTKYELVINLKTANALGLTVSPKLRQMATEVIE